MKPLSDYWAGDSHRALRGVTAMENRLAIALTPIRSIIRVIDDSRPPMTVDWCKVGNDAKGKPLSMSYTDFSGARIAVNPLPIIENKLPIGQQIDVCAGFAMHEASHAKYSRDRWKYLIKRDPKHPDDESKMLPAFEPMQIAGYMWNLVEDIRIEAATSKNLKGARAYFDNLLVWMWDEVLSNSELPTEYGPDVAGKMKTVFHACRFPDKARTLFPAEMQAEVEWWSAWQQDYLHERTDVPTTIQRGLDHLGEDPKTKQELQEMAAAEAAERERGEKLRAQIERLMKEGIEGVPGVCITEDGEVRALSKEEAAQVEKLTKEELTNLPIIIPHKGSAKTSMRVRKPMETASSRRSYVGRPDGATEAMRTALVFRPVNPEYDIKLQRRGELDDEELYRFFEGDDRLYSERVIESKPDTLFGLLNDLSGSMMGDVGDGRPKIDVAQRLSQQLIWATHDMEGVSAIVWGHTGDSQYGEGSDVFRIWEPGDPLRRLGLISSLDHGNNYDGYAIAYCVDQMRNEPQPQKVLIVLSDGYPAGHNYGNREAENHMRSVVQWAASQGVTVIQIAIDSELRPIDQARMFGEGNWLPFTNEKQLPRDLNRVLGRFAK